MLYSKTILDELCTKENFISSHLNPSTLIIKSGVIMTDRITSLEMLQSVMKLGGVIADSKSAQKVIFGLTCDDGYELKMGKTTLFHPSVLPNWITLEDSRDTEIIKLPCFGIEISCCTDDIEKSTIKSELTNKAIEVMILEHFIAGIDVSSPAYLVGIESAETPVIDVPEGSVLIHKSETLNATVDEETKYLVDEKEFSAYLEDEGSEKHALTAMMSAGKTVRVAYEASITDTSPIESEVDVYINF